MLVATEPAPATVAPVADASRRFGVWTMGLVGGLLPSPSALILLLAAVAVGRSWFGVLLVVCFGLGMATTLAVVGLLARDLLRRVERLVTRRGLFGGQVRTVVGYAAAVSVCLIGAGLAVRTLSSLL